MQAVPYLQSSLSILCTFLTFCTIRIQTLLTARIYYYYRLPLAPKFAVSGSGIAFAVRAGSYRVQIDLT